MHRLDMAMQPEGLERRAKRLVVLDVDSTLIQDEVIELLAERGRLPGPGAGRHRAGDGRRARLRARRCASGCAASPGSTWPRSTGPAPPCASPPVPARSCRTLKRLGLHGRASSRAASPISPSRLADELALDHAVANELEVVDGVLTGEVLGDGRRPGPQGRAAAPSSPRPRACRCRRPSRWATAPTTSTCWPPPASGIAFNAKPVVQEAADTTVNVPYLDAILFVLGVTRDEVERADAAVD